MKTELHHLLRFIRLFFKRDSPQLCYIVFPFLASSSFLIFFSFPFNNLLNLYIDTTPKFAGADIAITVIFGFTLYCNERGFPIKNRWFK